MRCKAFSAAAACWLAPVLGLATVCSPEFVLGEARGDQLSQAAPLTKLGIPDKCESGTCGNNGKYGTAIDFVNSPAEAARLAKKDDKLVFVVHLSGILEDPKLT